MLAGYLHPCHPVALWHRAGSLATWLQWCFLRSWLLHLTVLQSVLLAQLARAEQGPQGSAEPHWLCSVAKMLQMQWQLCVYSVATGWGYRCQWDVVVVVTLHWGENCMGCTHG